MHHPKKFVLGFHGWDETIPKGAVYMVNSFYFLLGFFFAHTFSSSFFGIVLLRRGVEGAMPFFSSQVLPLGKQ